MSATVHKTDANNESTNSRTKCLANGLSSTVLKQFLANKLQPQIIHVVSESEISRHKVTHV